MKCLVPGCDTDDDVVSYTSVFFVKFPSEPRVQQQWFSQLEISDSLLMQSLVRGESKVCSCHFADDCFGHHPVYGYRFLLPKALPTIIPKEPKKKVDPVDAVEDDSSLDICYVYLNDSLKPERNGSVIPVDAPSESELNDETEAMEDEEVAEEVDDDEAVEEIGIEYANGKYYFLKLTDDPTDADAPETSAIQASSVESIENDTINASEDEASACDDSRSDEIINEPAAFLNEKPLAGETSPYFGDRCLDEPAENSSEERIDEDIQSNHDLQPKAVDGERQSETEEPIEEYLEDSDTVTSEHNFQIERDDRVEDGGHIETLDGVSISFSSECLKAKKKHEHRFFCKECGKGFPFKSQLDRHLLVHTKEKKFFCEVCEKGFSQKINLTIHMRVHTGEQPDKRYTCQICNKKCYRISELEVHLARHKKQFPHVCPVCTQRYSDLTSLYNHFRANHRDVMNEPELIELLAQSENAIVISDQEPTDIRHTDGRYECAVCGKAFRLQQMLARHKRKMHIKIYRCPHCPRKFAYKSLLAKHLPTHTLEKPYHCAHCSLAYTQRVNLQVHMRRKHPQVVNDQAIKKVAISKVANEPESQQSEQNDEDEEEVVQAYECEQCGKRFSRKPTLLAHLEGHANGTAPRTYDCEQCGLSLSGLTALQRHRWRLHGAQTSQTKMISSLDLRNVTIVPTDNDYYVEIEDEMETIHEDYGNED
uniref:Protein krueppel n=1 Tax=Anopheles farauti TaxID=69004 RepID=A0A182QBB8_9DIPT